MVTGSLGFESSSTPKPPERLCAISSVRPRFMNEISLMYTSVSTMIANMPRVIVVRNRRASGYASPSRAASEFPLNRSNAAPIGRRYAVTR